MKPQDVVEILNTAKKVIAPFVWVKSATETFQFYMNAGKWVWKTISDSSNSDRSGQWRVTVRPKYGRDFGAVNDQHFYFESKSDAQDFVDMKELTDTESMFLIS
ncbi:MAG: hypothetical protein WBA52_12110 [Dolichospermum sp.]